MTGVTESLLRRPLKLVSYNTPIHNQLMLVDQDGNHLPRCTKFVLTCSVDEATTADVSMYVDIGDVETQTFRLVSEPEIQEKVQMIKEFEKERKRRHDNAPRYTLWQLIKYLVQSKIK